VGAHTTFISAERGKFVIKSDEHHITNNTIDFSPNKYVLYTHNTYSVLRNSIQ